MVHGGSTIDPLDVEAFHEVLETGTRSRIGSYLAFQEEEDVLRMRHLETGRAAMHVCVYARRMEELKLLLTIEPDVLEYVDAQGRSPLLYALSIEDEKPDPNAGTPKSKRQALREAQKKTAAEMVRSAISVELCIEVLVEAGADMRSVDNTGKSAIHCGVLGNHPRLIEDAILAGVQVNMRDHSGKTALHLAAELGRLKCVRILLEHGAQTDARDRAGKEPIHYACSGEIVELLMTVNVVRKQASPAASKREPASPNPAAFVLLEPASDDELSLDSSSSEEAVAPGKRKATDRESFLSELQSQTARVLQVQLILAVRSGDSSRVRKLLETRASEMDLGSSHLDEGWTALHESILLFDEAAVNLMLDFGVNIDAQSESGVTPLLLAASGGSVGLVRLLLERGASINCVDQQGLRPLLLAAALPPGGNPMIKGPHGKGKGKSKKGKKGSKSAAAAAADGEAAASDGTACVEALLEHGASVNHTDRNGWTAVHHAAHAGNVATLRLLLAKRAHVQMTNNDGESPLHRAALKGSATCLQALLEAGAKAAVVDLRMQSPLHVAAEMGFPRCVRILCEHGVPLDEVDKFGLTPLMTAVVHGQSDCVNVLLQFRASTAIPDARGYTALDHAEHASNERMFGLLVRAGASNNGLPICFHDDLSKEEYCERKASSLLRPKSRPLPVFTVSALRYVEPTDEEGSVQGEPAARRGAASASARGRPATSRARKGAPANKLFNTDRKVASVYNTQLPEARETGGGNAPHHVNEDALYRPPTAHARPPTAHSRPPTGRSRPKSSVQRPKSVNWEAYMDAKQRRDRERDQAATTQPTGNRWMDRALANNGGKPSVLADDLPLIMRSGCGHCPDDPAATCVRCVVEGRHASETPRKASARRVRPVALTSMMTQPSPGRKIELVFSERRTRGARSRPSTSASMRSGGMPRPASEAALRSTRAPSAGGRPATSVGVGSRNVSTPTPPTSRATSSYGRNGGAPVRRVNSARPRPKTAVERHEEDEDAFGPIHSAPVPRRARPKTSGAR